MYSWDELQGAKDKSGEILMFVSKKGVIQCYDITTLDSTNFHGHQPILTVRDNEYQHKVLSTSEVLVILQHCTAYFLVTNFQIS